MNDVVLVHGAWHGAWCWDGVVAELRRQDVVATTVELPLAGLAVDVAEARAAIEAAGPGCVVLGHSYGGSVITEAAAGLPCARLVYLAAFLTEPRADVAPLMAGSALLDSFVIDGSGLRVDRKAARDVFYADAGEQEAAAAIARLRPMPLDPGASSTSEAAWRSIPATYVVCTNDRALPVESQRAMAVHAAEILEWPTDHSPFLTRPEAIAELIVRHAG